jgi:hypothetical protein
MDGYDRAKDHYDLFLRIANSLSVAHAAGLFACVTAIKDYTALQIGQLILIFGGGLLGAILLYASLVAGRIALLQAIHTGNEPNRWSARDYWGSVIGSYVSIGLLAIAIILVMVRLGSF